MVTHFLDPLALLFPVWYVILLAIRLVSLLGITNSHSFSVFFVIPYDIQELLRKSEDLNVDAQSIDALAVLASLGSCRCHGQYQSFCPGAKLDMRYAL